MFNKFLEKRMKKLGVYSGVLKQTKDGTAIYYDMPEYEVKQGEVDIMQMIAYEERRNGKTGIIRN